MNTTHQPVHAVTAGDLMTGDFVVVPRQMLVREAARLLFGSRAGAAPVVDDDGHCIGVLSPADVFRWAEAGCPEAVVGPAAFCPYQVRGRLLNGDRAVMCTLSDGSCPFQVAQPTTGGRHTALCTRPRAERPGFGAASCFITTDATTVRPEVPLSDLVRHLVAARADPLVVLDELDRPIGLVSAKDVVQALAVGSR
jgi:CBS domain-containing protein